MSFWNALGIEPTRDQGVIKRAYAAQLKLTRPDEDAGAYQRLREAFQSAIEYAKSAIPAQLPVQPAASAEPDPERYSPDRMQEPDALVEYIVQVWRREGDEGLLALWPKLHKILTGASLALSHELSTELAHMVLEHRKMAVEFVDHMRQHFGWGSDFKRAPALSAAQSVAFSARLTNLAFEMKTLGVEREYVRLDQEKADEAAAETDRRRRQELLHDSPFLLQFAALVRHATGRQAAFAAALAGKALRRDWSALTVNDRAILDVDESLFARALEVIEHGLRLRAIPALAVLALAAVFQILGGSGGLHVAVLLALLSVCYFLPVANWHEELRARFFPRRLLDACVRKDLTDGSVSIVFSSAYSFTALAISIGRPVPMLGSEWRYDSDGALVFTLLLLSFQWLVDIDRNDRETGIIVPIYAFCATACWAVGIHDLLTIAVVSACWHGVIYATREGPGVWLMGVVCIFALIFSFSFYDGFPLLTASFFVPWILFKLAKNEGFKFCIITIAVASIWLPFDKPGFLAIWTGAAALAAMLLSGAMRQFAKVLVKPAA